MSDTRPFQRNVAQSELDELNARLARTRWTDQLPGVGWSHGVNGDYLRDSVGGQSICFASVRPSRSIEITNKISFEVVGSMTTSVDVLQYIKFALPEVSVTKAMKLVYYTQAWSLAWTGQDAFSDPVVAWQYGPTTELAYKNFTATVPRSDGISAELKSVIDAIIGYYNPFTATQLVDRTHSESPWKKTFNSLSGGHEAGRAIAPTDMKKEYTMQALKGVGPTRPSFEAAIIDDEKFEVLLSKIRTERREALDLLASR